MTSALKMLTENNYDIINRKSKHADTRSGDEIVLDLVKRAGLEAV